MQMAVLLVIGPIFEADLCDEQYGFRSGVEDHLHGVDRGDIVVFSRPPTENCGGPEVNDLVKRVIGLPGNVVSVAGGYVYIDGKRLDESWLPASEQGVTVAGPAGQQLESGPPVPGSGERLLRHGRQPDRLV